MTAVPGPVVTTSWASPRLRVVAIVVGDRSSVTVRGHFARRLVALRAHRDIASEMLEHLGEQVQATVALDYDVNRLVVGGAVHRCQRGVR